MFEDVSFYYDLRGGVILFITKFVISIDVVRNKLTWFEYRSDQTISPYIIHEKKKST